MDRASVLRKARAAWRQAGDPAATPGEAAAMRALAERLIERYGLDRREVEQSDDPDQGGGGDAVLMGAWTGLDCELVQPVLAMAGGALLPDLSGNAWLAGPRIALPRLRALADRLLALYRAEGRRIDAARARMQQAVRADLMTYILGPGGVMHRGLALPDKQSFWVGLTSRLVERLMPPPPPPNRTCKALVWVPTPAGAAGAAAAEGPAAAGATREPHEYEVKSQADFVAGRRLAEGIPLGGEPPSLPAPWLPIAGRGGADFRREPKN